MSWLVGLQGGGDRIVHSAEGWKMRKHRIFAVRGSQEKKELLLK